MSGSEALGASIQVDSPPARQSLGDGGSPSSPPALAAPWGPGLERRTSHATTNRRYSGHSSASGTSRGRKEDTRSGLLGALGIGQSFFRGNAKEDLRKKVSPGWSVGDRRRAGPAADHHLAQPLPSLPATRSLAARCSPSSARAPTAGSSSLARAPPPCRPSSWSACCPGAAGATALPAAARARARARTRLAGAAGGSRSWKGPPRSRRTAAGPASRPRSASGRR